IDDRQVLEEPALGGLLGVDSVDGFDARERHALRTAVGNASLADDLGALQQLVPADQGRGDEDVAIGLLRREVVVLGLAEPTAVVLLQLEDAADLFRRFVELRDLVGVRLAPARAASAVAASAAPAATALAPALLAGTTGILLRGAVYIRHLRILSSRRRGPQGSRRVDHRWEGSVLGSDGWSPTDGPVVGPDLRSCLRMRWSKSGRRG